MQVGDIVEWRAKNVNPRGKVVLNESSMGGEFLVLMENGKTFALDDLRFSKSFRVVCGAGSRNLTQDLH